MKTLMILVVIGLTAALVANARPRDRYDRSSDGDQDGHTDDGEQDNDNLGGDQDDHTDDGEQDDPNLDGDQNDHTDDGEPDDHNPYGDQNDHNDDGDKQEQKPSGDKEDHKYNGGNENHKHGGDKEDDNQGQPHHPDDVDDDDDDDDQGRPSYSHSCVCGTQCDGNNGTRNMACGKRRNEYLQCVDTVCNNQTCATDQLFNSTSGDCELCPSGFHVDATKRRCVCNKGTTPECKTGICGPCPADSIETDDRCYCSNTTALNKAENACQECPTGSNRTKEGCRCLDKKQFWKDEAFACQPCPGTWVNKTTIKHDRQQTIEVCECKVSTDVFNKKTVTCAPCPVNSTLVTGKYSNSCRCTVMGEQYDDDNNTCVARTKPDKNHRSD